MITRCDHIVSAKVVKFIDVPLVNDLQMFKNRWRTAMPSQGVLLILMKNRFSKSVAAWKSGQDFPEAWYFKHF